MSRSCRMSDQLAARRTFTLPGAADLRTLPCAGLTKAGATHFVSRFADTPMGS